MGSRVKAGSRVSVLISACREGNTHTTLLTKSAWKPHFESCPKGKDFILQCGHDGKCFLCSGYNTMKFKSNLILICNSHSFLALGVRDKEVCFLLFQPTNPHTHVHKLLRICSCQKYIAIPHNKQYICRGLIVFITALSRQLFKTYIMTFFSFTWMKVSSAPVQQQKIKCKWYAQFSNIVFFKLIACSLASSSVLQYLTKSIKLWS